MNLDVDYRIQLGAFESHMCFHLDEPAVGVFGPSGAGKSTLFKAIAGLIRPQLGHISLGSELLYHSDARVFIPPHRRRIGLVFQDARLFPHWSVEENLRAGEIRLKQGTKCPFSFDEVVDLLAVDDLLARSVTSLSGGEQQRIALGRALLSNARLLLMDEPVTGLDASLKAQILPFLSRVREAFGIPALYISHDLSEIQQLTDYIVLIRDGQNREQGPIRDLIQRPGVLKHFAGAHLLNLLKLTIMEHHMQDGVTRLATAAGTSTQSIYAELRNSIPCNTTVTVGLSPSEIALALHPIEGSSIQNQWPGRVEQVIHAPDRSLCIMKTDLGSLMVDIAPRAERQLDLHPGKAMYCLFKTKALKMIGTATP